MSVGMDVISDILGYGVITSVRPHKVIVDDYYGRGEIQFLGNGFTGDTNDITGGHITGINVKLGNTIVETVRGLHGWNAAGFYDSVVLSVATHNPAHAWRYFYTERWKMDGGPGNNDLTGGNFNDVLTGAGGNDTLNGRNGNDQLFGGEGSDQLFGGRGDDILNGNDRNDTLVGGAGNDTLRGGNQNDTIQGNQGSDSLSGNHGNDHLYGGGGRDFLTGGQGNDHLSGGGGRDRFIFDDHFGHDHIRDFDPHFDKIDLRAIQGLHSFRDIDHATNARGDAVINIDGDSITLDHVSWNQLHASDFLI